MLLSAVSVLVVAQSSSEIPEGLMNNPVFFIIIDCNVEWGGSHCKIPLAIYGWWSIVSLLLRYFHVNVLTVISAFLKIVKKFVNKSKNTSHTPELLMSSAHFLTLFSIRSVSIVITVLLDDSWISASFLVGVQLASYLVSIEYAFLYEKAARAWCWPCTYVWCWYKKFVHLFLHSLVPYS